MPPSRVINHDDELHVQIGGRKDLGRKVRLPSLKSTRQPSTPKVIVKVRYMRAGRVKGYANYIERDGTAGPSPRDGTTAAQGYSGYIGRDGAGEDGQRAQLFTRAGETVDREAFVEHSQGDPRAWTIIVSPGNGLAMTRYVREFMVQIELDLGRRLDWIAATHRNTKFTHSHILVRGKDRDGHGFRLKKAYIQEGFRTRATEIATLQRRLSLTNQRAEVSSDRGRLVVNKVLQHGGARRAHER